VIVITSDRGLCGGYNSNLIRSAEKCWRQFTSASGSPRSATRPACISASVRSASPEHALERAPIMRWQRRSPRVSRDFADGSTDAVYLVYSQPFPSALSQVPTVQQVLPVESAVAEDNAVQVDYIYEPDAAALLDRLLRQYITTVIDQAFLEAIASEHGARMTAMENATANASEMIDRLTLAMNRARQAAITTELMEIVSGAEAGELRAVPETERCPLSVVRCSRAANGNVTDNRRFFA
jgi:F-type H+-transporting ATPase subunit gamma